MRSSNPVKTWLIVIGLLGLGSVSGGLYADCSKLSSGLKENIDAHLTKYRNPPHCTHIFHTQQVELVLYYVDGACLIPGQSEILCEKRTLAFIAGQAPGTSLTPLQIGASNDFLPREISRDGNTIVLRGARYAEEDPPCCPTIPDQRRLRVTRGGFILIGP